MGVSSVQCECIDLLTRVVVPSNVDITEPLPAWGQILLPGLVVFKDMDVTL